MNLIAPAIWLFVTLSGSAFAQSAVEVPSKWMCNNFFLSVMMEHGSEKPTWWVGKIEDERDLKKGRGTVSHYASPQTATEVLNLFMKEPIKDQELGLCMQSWTYAVPFTFFEKKEMTPEIIRRFTNGIWKPAEDAFVKGLIDECEKTGTPLFVNLSGDLKKKWKQLTSFSKLDLSKRNQLGKP